jgi:hypothetical protein
MDGQTSSTSDTTSDVSSNEIPIPKPVRLCLNSVYETQAPYKLMWSQRAQQFYIMDWLDEHDEYLAEGSFIIKLPKGIIIKAVKIDGESSYRGEYVEHGFINVGMIIMNDIDIENIQVCYQITPPQPTNGRHLAKTNPKFKSMLDDSQTLFKLKSITCSFHVLEFFDYHSHIDARSNKKKEDDRNRISSAIQHYFDVGGDQQMILYVSILFLLAIFVILFKRIIHVS